MKNVKAYIFVLAAALCSVSCLDQLPEDGIPDTEAIRTLSDAEQTVNGIYATFKSASLYSGSLTLLPDIQCDMVYMVEGNTNTYGNFWRWEVLPNDVDVEGVYSALYSVVSRCNFFFAYVDALRATIGDDAQLDALQELEGHVHFARALAYSELVKLFCKAYDPATAETDPGVVLTDDYYNPGVAVRASLDASYRFILSDLTKAEEYIVETPYFTDAAGAVSYFSPAAVDALFARVYLYMQNWAKAAEYATKVIDNSDDLAAAHTLASVNTAVSTPVGTMSQYQAVWHYDQGAEIIWRVGFTSTSYGGALGRVFLNYNQVNYRPDYVVADGVYNSFAAQDRRRETFFASGLSIGYGYTLTQPLLVKYEGNYSLIAINQRTFHSVSMPKPFRLSEQYLIRAEARCRMAGQGVQGMSYSQAAADIATLRGARYTAGSGAVLTADTWLDIISEERVKELFMEGFRLHDLKRWGRGFERTPQSASVKEGSSLKIAAGDSRFVWPIPQHEIDSPGSQIVQN